MSGDFQNRLRKNLERPAPAEHPAPDVLNAYIEKVLTPTEERQVTEHLAACGECREVVFLATGAAEEPVQPVVSAAPVKRVRWWAWALPVAAVAVVASAVFLNQHDLFAPKKEATQIAQARHDEAQPATAANSAPTETNATSGVPAPKSEAVDKSKSLATYEAEAQKRQSQTQPAGGVVATPAPAASPSVVQRELAKEKDANQPAQNEVAAGKLEEGRVAQESKPAMARSAPAAAVDNVQSLKQSQGAAANLTADSSLRDEQTAFATDGNNSTVEAQSTSRAKTANLNGKTAGSADYRYSAGALVAKKADVSTQWRVTQEGSLEHFLLGKWQPALGDSGSHFLTVTTFGENVWSGGKNLALYHSADNGVTWVRQTLRIRIAADIVEIAFTSANDGVLTTNLGTSFATHDGGKNWAQEKP